MSSRVLRTSLILVLALWAVLSFSGCQSSSGDNGGEDGDSSGGDGCTTNEECMKDGENWACNVAAKKCIELGECTSNDQCKRWYDDSWYCDTDAKLCIWSGGDGDGGEGEGEGEDGDEENGVTCTNLSGFYQADTNCSGSNETFDAWVSVDTETCTIIIFYDGKTYNGNVNGDVVTLENGCTGTGTEGGDINLNCEGGCWLDLSYTQNENNAAIDVDPDFIRFGNVEVGDDKDASTLIRNDGSDPLSIAYIGFTEDTPSDFTFIGLADLTFPITIEEGKDMELWVKATPTKAEETTGKIVVFSNDTYNPVINIGMSYQPKAKPDIVCTPTTLDFGSQPPGKDKTDYFMCVNQGDAAGQIKGVVITDDQEGAYTLILTPEIQPPLVLEAGDSAAYTINFKPIDGVHDFGDVLIGSSKITWVDPENAATEKNVTVELVGMVRELDPPCLDIKPLEGSLGWMGMGDNPGPGIKFGYTQVGTGSTRQIEIHNCGDLPLTISGMAWQNAFLDQPMGEARAFFEGSGQFGNVTIQGLESIYIDMTFLPVREGTLYSSAFLFYSNAEWLEWLDAAPVDVNQAYQFGVSGYGANRGLEVLPSKVDFGVVTVDCCSQREEVKVYNVGDMPLVIESIEIDPGSDPRFEITYVDSTLPVTIGGVGNADHVAFKVKFCAESEEDATGAVLIQSDMEGAAFVVPLQGSGSNMPHQQDTFRQPENPMVDILWIVDCSGSMMDEQENLADNFEDFISTAITWSADLHIGLTSCDIAAADHSGKFQGSPAVLKNRGPDALPNNQLISLFEDRAELGTSCDGNQEAGLEAGHLALTAPLIDGVNDGFLRDDAKLSVIFLSDEEDQSVPEIPFYIDFYRSIKGMHNVNMLEVYAICGDKDGGCQDPSDPEGGAAAGKRYIDVAEACNPNETYWESICMESYAPIYDMLAENLFALRNQFNLSRLADPDTIAVKVNGTPNFDWDYDEETNSIVFPADDPPGAGSIIVVDYDTICLDK